MKKRIIDIVISLFCIFLLLIPFLVIAFLVWTKFGKPIFFTQLRPGLNGKPFRLIKFRTMTNQINSKGKPLPDRYRLTSFGSFLRTSSLDEIPEFWNVLRGDMSIVGPRPLLMQYMKLYNSEQARRHSVRPGITGWAQVNGRNSITWEKKFSLDIFYVDNQSIWFDLKIIFLTIVYVIKRENIIAKNHSTMPNFRGNKKK